LAISQLKAELGKGHFLSCPIHIEPHNFSRGPCCMDLSGHTTSVGTRTDYSVGPWDYLTCATRYLMA
jgi:hypothetical protein